MDRQRSLAGVNPNPNTLDRLRVTPRPRSKVADDPSAAFRSDIGARPARITARVPTPKNLMFMHLRTGSRVYTPKGGPPLGRMTPYCDR